MTVDLSDPTNPVRLATVPNFDPVASPAPPPGHAVWSPDYPYSKSTGERSLPCRLERAGNRLGHASAAVLGPRLELAQPLCAERARRHSGGQSGTLSRRHNTPTEYHGVKFYDISERAHPNFLSYWEAPASPQTPKPASILTRGEHIISISMDPTCTSGPNTKAISARSWSFSMSAIGNPVEAGKWWLPGQKTPEEDGIRDWEQQGSFSNPVVRTENGK